MKTIAAAAVLDWIAGDPEWFPHPVRWIGRCAELTEPLLRRSGQGPLQELVTGTVLTAGIVGLSYFAAAKAARCGGETLLAWTCLASRNLVDESIAVIRALEKADLPRARRQLARIVGRDTEALGDTEIHRALIETLAESACDGIVAPLFYMAVGGVPLAVAYKAVNTLDSMIGHADQRYFYFGKAAARLDDAANYFPSRLTALAIVIAAGMGSETSGRSAVRTWWRDGGKHKSPNAGQPESAMAGALKIRLGGENTYAGERVPASLMGAAFEPPMLHHAQRAVRLVIAVSLLSAASAVMVRHLRRR